MKTIALALMAALAATAPSFARPKTIEPEYVDMLLAPYFELQTSLAKDDLASAKKNATAFRTTLSEGPSLKDAPSLWGLKVEATKIAETDNLKTARTSFLSLSNDLAHMVERFGTSGQSDVLLMRCPMAFDGEGGEWLQNSDELANPYYGAMMYKCGSVQKKLASSKTDDGHGTHDHGDHSGHNH